MRDFRRLDALLSAGMAVLLTASSVHAQLYSETFPKVGPGDDPLTAAGWDATSATGTGMFDHAGTNLPGEATTPDGADAGTAFHYRNTNGAQAIWTTEFAPITPGAGGVDIIWYQSEDELIAGSTLDIHAAVMVGGQWYASERGFTTADTNNAWQRIVLPYTTTAANWRLLTLNAGSATIGAAPGGNLVGDIAGLGLVSVMSHAVLGNESVWYDYISINAHVIPGDVNGVGGVTIDDYNIIKNNYRTNVALRALGDLNADGFVDVVDFREWKANYSGAIVVADLPIPEPTGGVLACTGAAFLAGAVRRRAARSSQTLVLGAAGSP
jgi:hypothetical protein